MKRFEGQKALLTGGSSGIGLATARQLHQEGAELTLLARDPEKLRAAAEQLGPGVKTVSVDIADGEALRKAFSELGDPVFDMLINNAGVTRPGHFMELPESCFQEMMDVNYHGAVNLTRLVLPGMIEQKRGHVAFVSSLLGLLGIWGYTAYAASKFAIRGFAECLRCEMKPRGIAVTVCYPPDTDTPQHDFEKPYLPAETVAQAGTAGLLSPEQVAASLLEGISKGRFDVVPGGHAKFVATANRMVPGIVRAALDHDASKAKRA